MAIFLCLPFLTAAQTLQQHAVIEGRFDGFTTDELGNVYALKGDVLELFDANGKSRLKNSLKTFGRITTMDAFYSLKPMVFSQEQGQMAVLDNTLSLQGSVFNLPRNGYPQVTLAAMSTQNHFWFFDQRDMEYKRVNAKLTTVNSTGRIDQLLGHTPHPTQMQETDNWLYVNDPEQGILMFDLFASYYKTIPILGAYSFEVRDGGIYFFRDGVLSRYDLRSFAIAALPVPPGIDALDMRMERGRLYVLSAEGITLFTVVDTDE